MIAILIFFARVMVFIFLLNVSKSVESPRLSDLFFLVFFSGGRLLHDSITRVILPLALFVLARFLLLLVLLLLFVLLFIFLVLFAILVAGIF